MADSVESGNVNLTPAATTLPSPTAPQQGANYIPSHIIHTSVTAETLTDTLDYALESNMNM